MSLSHSTCKDERIFQFVTYPSDKTSKGTPVGFLVKISLLAYFMNIENRVSSGQEFVIKVTPVILFVSVSVRFALHG